MLHFEDPHGPAFLQLRSSLYSSTGCMGKDGDEGRERGERNTSESPSAILESRQFMVPHPPSALFSLVSLLVHTGSSLCLVPNA